ncbi:hypothetical protein EDF24_2615 [Curtobacterium sp. PhB130]|uniref:hypothetical protein n=1 Tax=unclassified Curtobacterium TaxID=257496 RepID=UPI000F4C45F2|nr:MULTISPECIES: hypothetical protein [unclassified Curtobacterium]ROS75171.1 hypothetical protein EDF24_2615 [Curtobacterium sp. PhB130]TCK63796.1 hypothetical protein EDF27_2343 [Curtobacterium sp. PhB136]
MSTDAEAELAALRVENARLRAELDAATGPDRPAPARRGRAWVIPSAALIVIGAILAPVAVVSAWADRQLTSTEAFVQTFAPLARDQAVQSLVVSRTIDAVDEQLDVRALTKTVFDGVGQLDLPPRAAQALSTLQAPAAAGVEELVHQTVRRFVASDAFAELWQRLLRTGHTQMVGALSGDDRAAVTIAADGSIGIQLGPIVAEVKERLLDRGISFASRLPEIDRTIVVASSDAAVRAQTAYALVQVTALWLPWLVVACIGVGVVMARRRSRALALAAVGIAVAMLVTVLGVAFGRIVTVRALAPDLMPRNAARAVYDAAVAFVLSASIAVTVLALSVAVVAWFSGSSRPAVRVRGGWNRLAAAARGSARAHGVTTGRVGEAVYRWRLVLRTLIALGAAAVIVLHRPLQPALIVWTLVGGLVAVATVELVSRPPGPADTAGVPPDDAVPAAPVHP